MIHNATDTPRIWQGIPGLERTVKGRVFVSWFTGGDKEPAPENTGLLCYSNDQGQTFTEPQAVALPQAGTRCFDPTLWIDPKGRLWYIFNRGNKETAVHDVWARICADPEATPPVFGAEFRVGYEVPFAFRMNKPTALASGEWIMPVTHASEPVYDWFAGSKQLQGVGISTDEGRTWKLHGALQAPEWALECMITELRDDRLWMLIRAGGGFRGRIQCFPPPQATLGGPVPRPGGDCPARRPSALLGRLLALRGALLVRRLGRLLLGFLLAVHTLAHGVSFGSASPGRGLWRLRSFSAFSRFFAASRCFFMCW